jgi:hypothetical protein
VSTALATLSANNIDAGINSLLYVLRVTYHVHDGDLGFVHLVYDIWRRDTDCADEELGTRLDDDVDELVQLSSGVVFVCLDSQEGEALNLSGGARERGMWCHLASCTADLGNEEIDAKGSVLVVQRILELLDLLSKVLGRVADLQNDSQTV